MEKMSTVSYNRKLKKMILSDKVYSMEEFKIALGESSDLEIIKNMLSWLRQYMNAFNFSNCDSRIIKVFDYLKNYSNSELEPIGIFVHEYISKLKERTNILIKRKDSENKINIKNKQVDLLLYDFVRKLDAFDINFTYNLKLKYDGNLYKLIKYIAFSVNSIDFLDEILKRWPNVVNAVNKKGKSIFEVSVKKTLNTIMFDPENRSQLVYYFDLMKCLMLAPEFRVNDNTFKNIRESIYKYLDELPSNDYKLNSSRIKWLKEFELILDNPKIKKNFFEQAKYYGINLDTSTKKGVIQQERQILLRAREIAINNLSIQKSLRERYDNYILSIDSVETLDVDDCLSIELLPNGNKLLGVHISDPLGYLPYNAYFTNEAKYKAETIYLKDSVIPMYPTLFSNNVMSLLPGSDKLTNSYFFEFSSDGIERFYCKKLVINNDMKASYNKVNRSLKNGTKDYKFDSICHTLSEISSQIEIGDKSYNYLKYKTLERGKFCPTEAEMIIMKLMLLTNSNVAKLARDECIPFLYRSHKIETVEKGEITRLLGKLRSEKEKLLDNNIDVKKCIRLESLVNQITPAATYELDGVHDGLGLGEKEYCHITSPIRRFADVVNNHCLDVAFFNTPSDVEIRSLENDVKSVKNILNEQISLNKQFVLSLGRNVDKGYK